MKLRNKKTGQIVEIAGGWEVCYKKAPLIKDEKVRNAVRAWAEVLGANEVEFYGDRKWLGFRTKLFGSEYPSSFELNYSGSKNTLVAFKTYTIAELCGDEEE